MSNIEVEGPKGEYLALVQGSLCFPSDFVEIGVKHGGGGFTYSELSFVFC